MIITQAVIDQVHDMLQWDRCLLEADEVSMVPRTGAGLMRVCQVLEAKYGKPTELVIIQWSVAELLIQEQVDIFTNGDWNFNSVDDQQRLDELQAFKSGFRTGLYEAGYVGILDNRIPVVASIHAHTCALATVASAPNQVEVDDVHNTIYIRWA